MIDFSDFERICPTVFADILGKRYVFNSTIQPMWQGIENVAGPAFPVCCPAGDILMLHKAVYLAKPGNIIVAKAGDNDYAVLGGNFMRLAKKRGVRAIIVDGMIRDLAEIRQVGVPVFAKGVSPIAGARTQARNFDEEVECGGVHISLGDIIVASEEGIMTLPKKQSVKVLKQAQEQREKEEQQTEEEWEKAHYNLVESAWQKNFSKEYKLSEV